MGATAITGANGGNLYFILLFSVHKKIPSLVLFCLLNALNSFQPLGGLFLCRGLWCAFTVKALNTAIRPQAKPSVLSGDHTSKAFA